MGAWREVVSAVRERSLRLRSACPFEAELIRQADAEGSARSSIGTRFVADTASNARANRAWAPSEGVSTAAALNALVTLFAPAEIVCYERGRDLTLAADLGFAVLGGLRVWTRVV
jgi:hypothetical protein